MQTQTDTESLARDAEPTDQPGERDALKVYQN